MTIPKEKSLLTLPLSSESTLSARAEEGHAIFQEIQQRKAQAAYSMVRIGKLLKRVNDEKIYKDLGFDTFAEFYGSPEISFSKAKVYQLIDIYELWIERFGYEPEVIATIEFSKLVTVNPRVKEHPDEAPDWLYKTRCLSRSDLKRELAIAGGARESDVMYTGTGTGSDTEGDIPSRATVARTGEPRAEDGAGNSGPDEALSQQPLSTVEQYQVGSEAAYYNYVATSCRCCVCGAPKEEVDPHHYPRTRGAGGEAHKYKVIPLCRSCHMEEQPDPIAFYVKYRNNITDFFYDLIFDQA